MIHFSSSLSPTNAVPVKTPIPTNTEDFVMSITRSDTFHKSTETPAAPLIKSASATKKIKRSETFDTEAESISPPPLAEPTDTIPPASIVRSDTFVSKPESTASPPPPPIEPVQTYMESRSNTFVSKSQTPPPPVEITLPTYTKNRFESVVSTNETLPITNPLPLNLSSSIEQPEPIPIKADIPIRPGTASPRKAPTEGKHPIKAIYSYLNEARRWAEQTHDITYSNILLSLEETFQQILTRKTGGTLRKLPDIDAQVLIKAAKSQSAQEVCSTKLFITVHKNLILRFAIYFSNKFLHLVRCL